MMGGQEGDSDATPASVYHPSGPSVEWALIDPAGCRIHGRSPEKKSDVGLASGGHRCVFPVQAAMPL
jgi:hypothetical protein